MLVPLMVQLLTLVVLNSSCLGNQNPELQTTPLGLSAPRTMVVSRCWHVMDKLEFVTFEHFPPKVPNNHTKGLFVNLSIIVYLPETDKWATSA